MNKLKLNNSEFELESYSKNTTFNTDSTVVSTANCQIRGNNINALTALANTTITILQIYHDDELIYSLQDVEAHMDGINEYLVDDRVIVNINLTFNMNHTND